MYKPDIKFTEARPGHTQRPEEDAITVNSNGLRLSGATYKRMGYPESVKVEVSEDKQFIRLTVPGPFPVRTHSERGRGRPGGLLNGVAIPRLALKGYYLHSSENLFVRQ